MKIKAVSGIMLTLLLSTSILALTINIQPVKAFSTVYIRADGLIDPPTAPISTVDNVTYTFTDNMDASFTIERDNIVVDGSGYTIGGPNSEMVTISGRNNVTIQNMTLRFYDQSEWPVGVPLLLEQSTDIEIVECILGPADTASALQISSSSNCFIYRNDVGTMSDGGDGGISISFSSDIIIQENQFNHLLGMMGSISLSISSSSRNIIQGNYMSGYVLISSSGSYNTIFNNAMHADRTPALAVYGPSNNIIGNQMSVHHGDFHGRALVIYSPNNTVVGNEIIGATVYNNESKLQGNRIEELYLVNASRNMVHGNQIDYLYLQMDSWLGAGTCANNTIYHNIISEVLYYRGEQGELPALANVWDDGYPSGGNYWSDYGGVDLYSGPYQNESGGDGIGDTPYLIAPNNRDNYPFMEPYYAYDVAIIDVSPSETVVPQGETLLINATVRNEGRSISPVTFNLTIQATYWYVPQTKPFLLLASAVQGWNLSTPGPSIEAYIGDTIALTLDAVDNVHHRFYVDYNGNAFPDNGEPQSPDFINTAIPFNFVAGPSGDFTYYCAYNQATMFGPFKVNPEPHWSKQIASQNVTLTSGEEKNVTFSWDTNGFALGNYVISAYAKPVLGEIDTADNTYEDGSVAVAARRDIAVTSVVPSKTVIGQSRSVNVDVTVENRGSQTETFNVTAYANSTDSGDSFNDNSLDFDMWKTFEKNNGTVSEVNGRVECLVETAPPSGTSGYITKRSYDVPDCEIQVDVSNQHLCEAALAITLDGIDDHYWYSNVFYVIEKHRWSETCKVWRRTGGGERLSLHDASWTGPTGSLGIKIHNGTIYLYEDSNIRYSEQFALSSYNCYIHFESNTWGDGYFGMDYFDNFRFINNKPIDTEEVTLSGGNSTTITFTWDTTDFFYGNYTMSACATPVPNEIDTADNTCTYSTVIVTITGDMNGDCSVETSDLLDLSEIYGCTPQEPDWNPNCDVNGDGKIDALDLFYLSKNYGKTL